MRQSLLFILFLICCLGLQAQTDSIFLAGTPSGQDILRDAANINVSIYPVPVRENSFTIKTDNDITFIKITNVIGQDILRVKYNNPEQSVRIFLDNPKRGMYLVTILFKNGTKVVKKIMVEES
jgi:hypothetical protein